LKAAISVCIAAFLGAGLRSISVSAADVDADGDFTIGPNYNNAPELPVRAGVPRGAFHVFTMKSEESEIYPGIAKNQPGTAPYQRLDRKVKDQTLPEALAWLWHGDPVK
jgi:hypothetical protein